MWTDASQQLLRALRGNRSQRAFSMHLGYRGNPVRDWESGRRFPTATTALRAAQLVGVDVPRACSRFQGRSGVLLESVSDKGVAQWLSNLRGPVSIVELASRSSLSRQAVGRWLNGHSRPRLPDFLRLLEAITGRCSDFVAELVDIKKVPAVYASHQRRLAAKELAYVAPWTEAVMRVLETRAYQDLVQHQEGWIAKRLGIDLEAEQECIRQMVAAGTIELHSGRMRPVKAQTIYTGTAPEKVSLLKKHWAATALSSYESPHDTWAAYNVMSLAKSDVPRVEEVLRDAYREIRSIVVSSEPEQTVALVYLHLLKWDVEL